MSLLSMWREIHESIPCDFACFVLFVFLFKSDSVMGESDDLPWAISETLWRENLVEYSRAPSAVQDYSQTEFLFRAVLRAQSTRGNTDVSLICSFVFLFFKSPSEIAPGSVAHVIPLYSAPSASFFLTDHKVIVFWGSKKKCQLEFIGMQEKTAFLCHENVTMLAMSCLDFEGLFCFQRFFF